MKNLPYYVIFLLIAVIFFMRMCGGKPVNVRTGPDTISVKHDTVWRVDTAVLPGHDKIKLVSSDPVIIWDSFPVYKPDTTYSKLLDQYRSLGNKYFTLNKYSTTYQLDSLGSVTLVDSVNQNQLIGSELRKNLRYPKSVTNTITIQQPYKPVTQVYIGGGILGNPKDVVSGFEAGFQVKSTRDDLFGAKAGINTLGQVVYGVSYYKKISFRKNK